MVRDLILIAISLTAWGAGEGMFLYFEPLYLQELGADSVRIGFIIGGVAIMTIISFLPAGYLSDRFGRRRFLRLAWLLGLTATWIMAVAPTLPFFVIGMALYAFTGFVTVPLYGYVTQARGSLTTARALTLTSAAFNIGMIAGPLIGGWIGEEYGLKKTFLVAAIFFVISTIIIFFISPQAVEVDDTSDGKSGLKTTLTPRYVKFLLITFFVMFALYLPQPLSQNFLENERGLGLTQIGLLISTRSVGLVVLNLTLGSLNARLGFLLSQALMGAFTLLMWLGTGLPWYLVAYFLLGSYVTARSFVLAQGRSIIHSARIGIGYALIETASASGAVIAAPIAGWLYKLDPIIIYPIAFSLILIGLVVSKFLSPLRTADLQK
jgi:MFS family permease